jgi:hypothetical protein
MPKTQLKRDLFERAASCEHSHTGCIRSPTLQIAPKAGAKLLLEQLIRPA